MKDKNKLLIYSTAIQIVFILLSFISINNVLQSTLNSFSTLFGQYPPDVQTRIWNLMQNHGLLVIGITYAIPLISNIFVLIISIKNNLEKNKTILVFLSIINVVLFVHIIDLIFAIIQLVVSIKIKKNSTGDSKEKNTIPEIEYKNSTKKEKIWAIIIALVYLSQFGITPILQNISSKQIKIAIVAIFYLVCFVLSIIAFKDKLKNDFKLLKNNFSEYFTFLLPRYLFYYLIYFTIAIICATILKTGISENQKNIEQLPIYVSAPLAIIWAPVVEEVLFRGVIRRFIKNNKAFILISGIVFGLIHTFDEGSFDKAILLSIPYMTCGLFLAYIYRKTNNLTCSMIIHCVNNIIATIITVLVTQFIF